MAAIYQTARPLTFAEVVGQDHVKDVLLAALERGRASHAYLFSGPRGVGKTTTARLLAMALNCEAESSSVKPCGSCDGCRMVRDGHHPDVIELDAASNNSVDDVRELREKTNLASMRGGSRVWILDEAHMLSRPAANALLKTLEEPPPGLVFILATTEPEKLPPTVLSRCQHFRFRRLAESEIHGKLERLCREAGVEAEAEALALVAKAADGAMRDAESLLERLLTPGSTITLVKAEEALGLPPISRMQRLATALCEAELATLLSEAEALYRDGFAPRSLAENLGTVLRDALRAEVIETDPAGATAEFRLPLERHALMRLIQVLDDEQDRFIRRDDLYSLEVSLIKGVNSLAAALPEMPERHDPAPGEAVRRGQAVKPLPAAGEQAPAAGLPSFDPTGRSVNAAAVPVAPIERTAAPASRSAANRAAIDTDAPPPGGANPSANAGANPADSAGDQARKRLDWHKVRSSASPQLKAFLMPARESVEGTDVTIRYGETHKFHYNELKKRESELASLIEEIGGPGFRLRIEGPGENSAKKS